MEKKAGEIPLLWATPSPLPPGQPVESEQVPPHTPPLAPREAATPTPAGCSCGVSSGHPCMHGDVPRSISSEPSHPHPLSSSRTQSLNAVTPSTAVCLCRLAFSIAWLSPPWKRPLRAARGQPLTLNPVGLASVWDKSLGLAAALYRVGTVAAALPRREDARPGACPGSH